MSASREKKQRQGAGPSEKALQAQQQQAARKRKTITYTAIGVVFAVLIAALLIWNSGFFQARATAVTVGDTKLTTAELSYYYYDARYEYASGYLGMLSGFDASTPDNEQIYNADDSTTYRDFFLDTAVSNAQRNAALAAEALKNGHTEAEVKEDLDAQIAAAKSAAASYGYSYSSFLKAQYGPYMTAGVYEKMTRQLLLANLAYTDKTTELSDGYTQDDLTAYYNRDENADALDTFEYSYLYFTPAAVETKDSEGNAIDEETVKQQKEEALAEAKKKAEEALAALKDGDTVSALASKYALADTAYADHTSVVGKSALNSVYQETLLALKDGESALAENGESGFYVVTYHGRRLVQDPTQDVRHILARAETTTDDSGNVVAPTDAAWAAAKAKIDAIQAEYEAGDRSEDSFAALANEKSDDGDGTTGGLYTKIGPDDGYSPEFAEWIFTDGRKAGDTGVVQHTAKDSDYNKYWGYHFIYLVGDNEPVWMRTARNALITEDRNAWMEELDKGFETSLSNGASYLGK